MRNATFILLGLSGCIAAWFITTAGWDLYQYSRLDSVAKAEVRSWKIDRLGTSKFGIIAVYAYEVNGQLYEGRSAFKEPYFLNQPSVESEIKKLDLRPWQVWYRANDPAHSSLKKNFPGMKLFNAVLTLGIFIYFYALFCRRLQSAV